jgi:hypothetical protein
MRARVLLGVASLVAAVGMLWASVTPARACSVGPDYDPIAESDVIVSGRFTSWHLIDDATRLDDERLKLDPNYYLEIQNDPKYYGPYDPIRVQIRVDRIYKGSAFETIEVIDGASLEVYDHDPKYVWVGASGACGTFDFDPTGSYAVVGLTRADDGSFRAGRFRLFYIGPQPPETYDSRPLSYVAPLLPGTLPNGGGRVMDADFPFLPALALAIVGPLAFLAGAALLRRRGGSHNG